MRILLGTETYRPELNGASYFSQHLAAALLDRGHEVRVLCPSRTRRSERRHEERITIDGIASVPVPLYRAYRCSPSAGLTKAVERAVRAFAPDVIHIQNHFFIGATLVHVARRSGIPVLATNHFIPDHVLVQLPRLPGWWRGLLSQLLWHHMHSVYRDTRFVTAPTQLAADLIARSGLDRPVIPVSCGVDLPRFSGGDRLAARARYSLDGHPTLLYVGRLDGDKHVYDILGALAAARHQIDARLLVVGAGKERQRLEEVCHRLDLLDAVTFAGFVPDDDLPAAYRAADAFCMAGTAELQSIATLEAMASGLPIIAARALALPHLVHDGINGYTFTPGDTGELAASIVAILGDRERGRQMGERSAQMVVKHDIARTVDAFEVLYHRVAKPVDDPV